MKLNRSIAIRLIVLVITVMLVCSIPLSTFATSGTDLLTGAYRVDKNGWVYLKLQGSPYQVGYQHGYLAASEIVHALEVYKYIASNWGYPWDFYRNASQYMWWPHMPLEYRQEIMGMAAGIQAKGLTVDWLDLVAANSRYDSEYYWDYLHYNNLSIPAQLGTYTQSSVSVAAERAAVQQRMLSKDEGCSSFVATGDATKNHEIVIGHETWTGYIMATAAGYNLVMDITPQQGNRMVMDAQMFAIYGGRDFNYNSAGLMETETTIPGMIAYYNPQGQSYFVRVRYALQYAKTIDEWVNTMLSNNNGAYANDYLLGDAKSGQIAEFELGTYHYNYTRTFNGFIGSSNYPISPGIVYEDKGIYTMNDPSSDGDARHIRWQQLAAQNYGKIDVQLGEKMLGDTYDTYLNKQTNGTCITICGHGEECCASGGAVDGKVTSSSLVRNMQSYWIFGRPDGSAFSAHDFLAKCPKRAWMSKYIQDMPANTWTLFPPA